MIYKFKLEVINLRKIKISEGILKKHLHEKQKLYKNQATVEEEFLKVEETLGKT